jgi:hypothetical protein
MLSLVIFTLKAWKLIAGGSAPGKKSAVPDPERVELRKGKMAQRRNCSGFLYRDVGGIESFDPFRVRPFFLCLRRRRATLAHGY